MVLEINVPAARATMPNLCVPSGLHSLVVQKLALSLLNAGIARQIRKNKANFWTTKEWSPDGTHKFGLHSLVVQKLALSLLNAGIARQIRKIAIAASTASSAMPAPRGQGQLLDHQGVE